MNSYRLIYGKFKANLDYEILSKTRGISNAHFNAIFYYSLKELSSYYQSKNVRSVFINVFSVKNEDEKVTAIIRYFPIFNSSPDERVYFQADGFALSKLDNGFSPACLAKLPKSLRLAKFSDELPVLMHSNVKSSEVDSATKIKIRTWAVKAWMSGKQLMLVYPDQDVDQTDYLEEIALEEMRLVRESAFAFEEFPSAIRNTLNLQFNYVPNSGKHCHCIVTTKERFIAYPIESQTKVELPRQENVMLKYIDEPLENDFLDDKEQRVLEYLLNNSTEVNQLIGNIDNLDNGIIPFSFLINGINKIGYALLSEKIFNELMITGSITDDLRSDLKFFEYLYSVNSKENLSILLAYNVIKLSENTSKWKEYFVESDHLNKVLIDLYDFPNGLKQKFAETIENIVKNERLSIEELETISHYFYKIKDDSNTIALSEKVTIDTIKKLKYDSESTFVDAFLFLKRKNVLNKDELVLFFERNNSFVNPNFVFANSPEYFDLLDEKVKSKLNVSQEDQLLSLIKNEDITFGFKEYSFDKYYSTAELNLDIEDIKSIGEKVNRFGFTELPALRKRIEQELISYPKENGNYFDMFISTVMFRNEDKEKFFSLLLLYNLLCRSVSHQKPKLTQQEKEYLIELISLSAELHLDRGVKF